MQKKESWWDKWNFGLRPPAQAPPRRDFCPGGRALWLGENSDCGISSKTDNAFFYVDPMLYALCLPAVGRRFTIMGREFNEKGYRDWIGDFWF